MLAVDAVVRIEQIGIHPVDIGAYGVGLIASIDAE